MFNMLEDIVGWIGRHSTDYSGWIYIDDILMLDFDCVPISAFLRFFDDSYYMCNLSVFSWNNLVKQIIEYFKKTDPLLLDNLVREEGSIWETDVTDLEAVKIKCNTGYAYFHIPKLQYDCLEFLKVLCCDLDNILLYVLGKPLYLLISDKYSYKDKVDLLPVIAYYNEPLPYNKYNDGLLRVQVNERGKVFAS